MADKKVDGKESVRLATNTNAIANLKEAPVIIDSVTMAEGDRILVKNKASKDGVEVPNTVRNGIYVVRKISGGSAILSRAKDANTSKEVTAGMYVIVTEGASNANTGWFLTTDDPIVLDTTPLLFEKFTNAGSISDSIQASINANSDNIALLAFRQQTQHSLTLQKMVEGVVDEYETEGGIDAGASVDKVYNSAEDFYTTENATAKLLLHFDGVDGSQTIIDSGATGYNVTTFGNAQLDTADKKFGTASGIFDGSGDYLTIPDDPDWAFGTNGFTMDLWIKPENTAPLNNVVMGQLDTTEANFLIRIQPSGTMDFGVFDGRTGAIHTKVFINSNVPTTPNVWQHISIIRVGNDLGMYINGVQVAYADMTGISLVNVAEDLQIGLRKSAGVKIGYYTGSMDELRISDDNVLSASPNVGLTDTYAVPTAIAPNSTVNTTLVSNAETALVQADTGRMVVFLEELETVVVGTDIKASVSRDNGVTYTEITLTNKGEYESGKNVLAGEVDISSQPAGTAMVYKIETLNNKRMNIHGSALSWK